MSTFSSDEEPLSSHNQSSAVVESMPERPCQFEAENHGVRPTNQSHRHLLTNMALMLETAVPWLVTLRSVDKIQVTAVGAMDGLALALRSWRTSPLQRLDTSQCPSAPREKA